jgi:hypothetical protein
MGFYACISTNMLIGPDSAIFAIILGASLYSLKPQRTTNERQLGEGKNW